MPQIAYKQHISIWTLHIVKFKPSIQLPSGVYEGHNRTMQWFKPEHPFHRYGLIEPGHGKIFAFTYIHVEQWDVIIHPCPYFDGGLIEKVWIPIEISLKFVPKSAIYSIPALVQIMAWRRLGDKPLSEPKMVSLPTHLCVTRPQWVRSI